MYIANDIEKSSYVFVHAQTQAYAHTRARTNVRTHACARACARAPLIFEKVSPLKRSYGEHHVTGSPSVAHHTSDAMPLVTQHAFLLRRLPVHCGQHVTAVVQCVRVTAGQFSPGRVVC